MAPLNLVPQIRIAINNRCQKACFYCRPAGEGSTPDGSYEMTADEIIHILKTMTEYGITDVKLTGGDPVLRSDIVELVARIKELPKVRQLDLITRHPRAGELASDLSKAGLDCLNFSLDTLDRNKYRMITGVEEHQELIDAIRVSVRHVKSIKINTVVMKGINDTEIMDLIAFCERVGVKTLKFLDLILGMETSPRSFSNRLHKILPGKNPDDLYFPLDSYTDLLKPIAASFDITYQAGGLGHPMDTFTMPSGLQIQVKDARKGAWYGDICKKCSLYPCHDALMALRLTSDGKFQRCLAREDNLIDVLEILNRENGDGQLIIAEVLATYSTAQFEQHSRIKAQHLHPLLFKGNIL